MSEIQYRGSPYIEFAEVCESRFLPNMDALLCRVDLQMGDVVFTSRWLRDKAPKDDLRIWALHCYQYLTTAMVLLANGEDGRVMIILARILPYTQQ